MRHRASASEDQTFAIDEIISFIDDLLSYVHFLPKNLHAGTPFTGKTNCLAHFVYLE